MKNLTDEIKLTIELMQGDIDDGAHGELQSHLYSLLEIKRNDLQQRLVERAWVDPAKPLTAEELSAGGWWCADTSEDCANALESKGLRVFNSLDWQNIRGLGDCGPDATGRVVRGEFDVGGKKQIHRIGNEFYWSEK